MTMTRPNDDPSAFGKKLPRPEFDLLDRETLKELIRKINDKSLSWEERDDAKNRLLLAHVRLIYGKVFGLTGGKIGIDDRQSELLDSAVAYLKERLSEMADAVVTDGFSLTTVVSKRLVGWFGDKIRRSDGQTLKRGKNQKQEPVTALADAKGAERLPVEEMIREETLAIMASIKAHVFQAVEDLDGLEHVAIVSHYGLEGGGELSLNEVAELIGESLRDVTNAHRRAIDKLKKWLKEHDPHAD